MDRASGYEPESWEFESLQECNNTLIFNNMNLNNKEELKGFIENGVPCYQQFGFSWKGAVPHKISKETALELLPKYSPGMGFWELSERVIDGYPSLVFTEYSESDMF